MIVKVTMSDKVMGLTLAISFMIAIFLFALIEPDVLKSVCILVFALCGSIVLPIVSLWPVAERINGHHQVFLYITAKERCRTLKISLSLMLVLLCIYLFVWVNMGKGFVGLVFIIGSIIVCVGSLIALVVATRNCSNARRSVFSNGEVLRRMSR